MPRTADILIADDERAIRNFLIGVLEKHGYAVRGAADGKLALALYRERRPDLLVLDVMMPVLGGYDVCREIRREDADTPVLFLTALDSESDELRGLGVGADDYIAKTVSEEVLLARIDAALRRHDGSCGEFDFGEWHVAPARLLMRNGHGDMVTLSNREAAVLRSFANHPGEVLSRDFLLTRYWDGAVSESSLNVAMHKLRGKLGAAGRDIRAVHGVGYVYRPPTRAIVSLGSNIEPRAKFLARALAELSAFPDTRLVSASSVHETKPVGVPPRFADKRFLNQVVVFETSLGPQDFSRRMHLVEDRLGRVRTVRNGPRTIDVDLVDFGGMKLDTPELTLPHPRAKEREFVTIPLAELGIFL